MYRVANLRRSFHSLLPHHRPSPYPHRPGTLTSTNSFLNPNQTSNFIRQFSSQSPSPSSSDAELRKYIGYFLLVVGCSAATYYSFPLPPTSSMKAQIFRYAPLPDGLETVTNWSGTHEASTRHLSKPCSLKELEEKVKECHEKRQKLRPLGTGLSPNGIGLSRAGMVQLSLLDNVLEVNKEKKTVRVQAGIRVQELVDKIQEHGLTLQNFASIREQQIGGIVQSSTLLFGSKIEGWFLYQDYDRLFASCQIIIHLSKVGAHGTGASLPPIDEQVISMKLVTPAKGTIELSKEKNPELFYLARCGLGGLGVVAEVTLQCVEREQLVEHTYISNMQEIKKNHKKLLSENKHIKYLYIPYTDAVVVVRCNPISKGKGPPKFKPKYTQDEALQDVRDLYEESLKKYRVNPADDEPDVKELSFTELRDKLIALDPLYQEHIIRINKAEAEFWRKSEGYRVGWSDEILGFDCGGQQWVSETCFPAGVWGNPSMKDLEYIEDLKRLIEENEIPAPAPIEQRWTARSTSVMSPASSTGVNDIFSWVGIIMYLPTDKARQRKSITEEFFHYRYLTQSMLWDRYSAYEHWAKIEVPKDKEKLEALQDRLGRRFPVEAYNRARKELDPNRILSNGMLEKLFPLSERAETV